MRFQKGSKHTEEAKEKNRLAHLGKKLSEETKLKMSNTRKGRKFSEEHRLKMSLAQLGEKNHNFGKKASEELRIKLSEAHKGILSGEKHPMFGKKGKEHPCYGIPCSEETRKKIAKANKGKLAGDKHPCWKGGITPENRIIRHSSEFEEWRKKVFKRDNWTCRDCGKRGNGELHAHHIKSFAKYPELRFDVNNGLTLCEDCHKKTFKKELVA
jgi:hypothetical protein